MSEMRERIARAIWEADDQSHPWDSAHRTDPAERERYLHVADAVLAAMREPTAEMIEAGAEESRKWDAEHGPLEPVSAFRDEAQSTFVTMIDAAIRAYPLATSRT